MKRGDVFWAELIPRSGSEQKGTRPVIVISHNAFNQAKNWRSVIVVPVSTSNLQAKRGPTVVPIPKGLEGLSRDSFAVCHQITTLDRSKLTQYLGHLPKDILFQVEQAIKAALDLLI